MYVILVPGPIVYVMMFLFRIVYLELRYHFQVTAVINGPFLKINPPVKNF